MIIEYDLTEFNQSNPEDDITTYELHSLIEGGVTERVTTCSTDAKNVGTYKGTGKIALKKYIKENGEKEYLPVHAVVVYVHTDTSSSYGVRDVSVDRIKCYDANMELLKTIESPGISAIDNQKNGELYIDTSDGTIFMEADFTVKQKEVGTGNKASTSLSLNKIYIDDEVMPNLFTGNLTIKANQKISKFATFVYMNFKKDETYGEAIIYSMPKGFYIMADEDEEIAFVKSDYCMIYPIDITLEAYDAEDKLLSTKTTTLNSSSDSPTFIYKEGLNYIKAKAVLPAPVKDDYSWVCLRYDSSSKLHNLYCSNPNGASNTIAETKSYNRVSEERTVMCKIYSNNVTTNSPTDVPMSEIYTFHIKEPVMKESSSSEVISDGRYVPYKYGDTIPVKPGIKYSIIVEKTNSAGNNTNPTSANGSVKDIYFIAVEDDGTTPIKVNLNTSRNTAVNSNILTDSKRTTNKEDATTSKTNREVVYGDDIQADIKRYSTKTANIISDTNRTIEKVNRVRVKADTQRNKRKRIEVRYDLSRKLLGHKDNVYISSSLVPLEKAISKKLY